MQEILVVQLNATNQTKHCEFNQVGINCGIVDPTLINDYHGAYLNTTACNNFETHSEILHAANAKKDGDNCPINV